MRKNFSHKRARRGFSLTEVLVAVAILSVFVSMAAVGTTALFGSAEQISAVSKAAVLGSDVMQIITNEVRYGENFVETSSKDGETEIKFDSASYGKGCTMKMQDGELILTVPKTDMTKEGETVTFRPIGTVAYDEVKIQSLTFTVGKRVDSEGKEIAGSCIVTVELSVLGIGKELWKSGKVSIVPLYLKYV